MPDLPRLLFQVDLDRTRLLAVAGKGDLISAAASYPPGVGDVGSSWRYWRVRLLCMSRSVRHQLIAPCFQSLGYVPVADLVTTTVEIRVGNGLVLPDLEVLLDRVEATATLCADTVAALAAFVDDLQYWSTAKSKYAPRPHSAVTTCAADFACSSDIRRNRSSVEPHLAGLRAIFWRR